MVSGGWSSGVTRPKTIQWVHDPRDETKKREAEKESFFLSRHNSEDLFPETDLNSSDSGCQWVVSGYSFGGAGCGRSVGGGLGGWVVGG